MKVSLRSIPFLVLAAGFALSTPARLDAQWRNRYPKLTGSAHHVYVEGYELPVVNAGISDPAESPDGRRLAVASHGWLWLLDRATGEAKRLTSGSQMDSRPVWSPDGKALAFVRDDGSTLAVVVRDLTSGAEREIERGFALDPAFSPDGRTLFYSSSAAGGLDIWRIDLASGQKTRVTTDAGLELRAQPHPDGKRLIYLSKAPGTDQVRVRTLADGSEKVIVSDPILSQMRPALSPDGQAVVYSFPGPKGWELRLMSVEHPGPSVLLAAKNNGLPLSPSWSADGHSIYFMESDAAQRLVIYRIAKNGGAVSAVPVLRQDWGANTGRVIVRTHIKGRAGPAAARIGAVDAQGHPIIPESGQARSDGQNGRIFFYSPGVIELTAPAGIVRVAAVQGIATPEVTARVTVAAGETREVDIELDPVWDARAAGWYSGDHHFHLNFGGQFPLVPEDLIPLLRGEAMDVATPLIGNLANRFEHADYWSWRSPAESPLIRFGQEVRPSLGHTGLIGGETFFWPWTFGAGTQLYAHDDISNVDPLTHVRDEGGVGTYMHPVQPRGDPFASKEALAGIPTELVADAVLGVLDALEVACVWSDELATAAVWHRFLNLGIPVVPNAGTDVMADFYRTPAVGTTRIYVRVDEALNFNSYMQALKRGRSFVTNGPLLEFRAGGGQPGDVIQRTKGEVAFTLDLHTAVPVDSLYVLVNGEVAWRGKGLESPGSVRAQGSVKVPAGGWIAAVATGGTTTRWPAMDSYAYAHTAPLWIGKSGSVDPAAAAQAARDLLLALDVAEARVNTAYAGADVPKLRAHFQKARRTLEERTSKRHEPTTAK